MKTAVFLMDLTMLLSIFAFHRHSLFIILAVYGTLNNLLINHISVAHLWSLVRKKSVPNFRH